ncbi:MAG: hypothetical protein NZ932_04125, partial [Candidatus Bathyarchaeota archaeon]|nr:hypothetical protein [Candidatus Bathyarchaeota archaeon]MDW8022343.1 hypothetical protein [Nitrososphaerota archaeon]
KYVTKQGDKWLLVDDGYGHHHTFLVGRGAVATIGVIVKEVTKQEATDRLISYLKCLGKRENWTKFELTNYTQEEGLKLYTCPKCHEHDIVYDESEHWCEEAE